MPMVNTYSVHVCLHLGMINKCQSLVAQIRKNLPSMQETQIQSLDHKDPQEKGMTTRSSILAWKIPWTEEPGKLQSSSVRFSCSIVSLCDPMDCSTPGFPILHQLLELTQTHVYWVSDAIQPSHPLSSPSPPAFNLSQHQSLFLGVMNCIHGVAKNQTWLSDLQFQLFLVP